LPISFVIVEVTNENETLEANVSASDNGLRPSKPSFHLMLGPAPNRDIVLTPAEVLRRIGFAIADQLKDEEEMIRREAEGARSLMMGLEDGGHVVLRFDIGVSKQEAMDALIDGGLDRQRASEREPQAKQE
jgi:hypothetical protein